MNFTIRHGEDYRVARLFRVLSEGERVASKVANLQSKFVSKSDPRISKFFRHQAKQERFHHGVFSFAERWITPKGTKIQGESRIFDRYEKELTDALKNNQLDHSIVGLQVVLEALGDSFLDTIDERMEQRNMGLDRLRRMIRFQEQAHQDFGMRYFAKQSLGLNNEVDPSLRSTALTQVAIIDELIESISLDLEALGLDAKVYSESVHNAVDQLDFRV